MANEIGIDPGSSTVNIRNYIKETIKKYHLPVGAHTHYGYFIIENEEELKEYKNSLQNRISEITEKIAYINALFYKYYEDFDLELTGEIFERGEEDSDMSDDEIL